MTEPWFALYAGLAIRRQFTLPHIPRRASTVTGFDG